MIIVSPDCEFQIFGQKKKAAFFWNTSKLFFYMLLGDIVFWKEIGSNWEKAWFFRKTGNKLPEFGICPNSSRNTICRSVGLKEYGSYSNTQEVIPD